MNPKIEPREEAPIQDKQKINADFLHFAWQEVERLATEIKKEDTLEYWIRSQYTQLRLGGVKVLFGKCCVLIPMVWNFAKTCLAIPAAVIMRLVSPFALIRVGPLLSSRIGHFAANTEVYLCERDAGMHGKGAIDIFYHTKPICNHQLKKMWDRTLCVWQPAGTLDRANRLLPGGRKHIIPLPGGKRVDRDVYALLGSTKPHIYFMAKEEEFGSGELRRLGITKGEPFVCFHARDPEYLRKTFKTGYWHYHDYRDSNIQNYIPAAEELVRRNYFAVRTGAIAKEKLNISNPKIIDYAVNYRSDFMDIYLGAKCYFFICDTAGIYAIPEVFRQPIAWVNFIPLEHVPTWSKNQIFIPKKIWLKAEKRFLTFREILDSGMGRLGRTNLYERLGTEVIENTPEEIKALVIEMDERLKGRWQITKEDEELQRLFWSLFKPSELNRVFLSRIGAEFLRQNRHLLE